MAISIALAAAVTACGGGGGSVAVPKPTAFPRVAVLDSSYTSVPQLPVPFQANAHAVSSIKPGNGKDVWLDVAYSSYDGVLNVTFSHAADSAAKSAVVDNRLERMRLNLAGGAEELQLVSPAGYHTTILVQQGASLMPVQFISVGREWVVSGMFSFKTMPTSIDSIRPVIDAVKSDMIHAAKTLGDDD
ncbi:MAG: hypothetical protein NC189_00030 [Bacteroides sp.]|nr:hypothetical protein [Bacteroides sp.]